VGKIRYILCLLLFIQIQFAFSQSEEWDNPGSRSFKDNAIYGLIASGETLLSNVALMLFNSASGQPWAVPTTESTKGNFTRPWDWEGLDRFIVNQLGHPFQGSNYFVAGRVNGFSFYESMFFNALGSFTWEALCESQHASINDFFTTLTGAMSAGEILYRLHLEAHAAGAPLPLTFLVSPMGGFHILITNGKKTPNPGKNIYQLQTYFGGGYVKTHYSASPDNEELFSFKGGFGDIGLKVIYGDPFEQHTAIPYRHFELDINVDVNPANYNSFRVISDGYLFSFSPICNAMNALSTGLTMHLDFVSQGSYDIDMYTSTINQYSNALDWTVKYQHLFSDNSAMEIKYHAGFTFFGASNYYNPDGYRERSNNYGYGLNSKLFFGLENKKLGRLDTDVLVYALWPYSVATSLLGTTYWVFTDITYSRFVSKHFSVGSTCSLAREWGSFDNFQNTKKKNDSVKVFVAWNF